MISEACRRMVGAGGVQRIRASDDPRSGDGGAGSSAIIRQAIGQAEDGAIPGGAYACWLWMRGAVFRETAKAAEDIRCQGERGQADVGERDRLTPRSPFDSLLLRKEPVKQKSAFRP